MLNVIGPGVSTDPDATAQEDVGMVATFFSCPFVPLGQKNGWVSFHFLLFLKPRRPVAATSTLETQKSSGKELPSLGMEVGCLPSFLGVRDLGPGDWTWRCGWGPFFLFRVHMPVGLARGPECVDCRHWNWSVCSFQLEPGICLCPFSQ